MNANPDFPQEGLFAEETTNTYNKATILSNEASTLISSGSPEKAIALSKEAMGLLECHKKKWDVYIKNNPFISDEFKSLESMIYTTLAQAKNWSGNYEEAKSEAEKALFLVGDKHGPEKGILLQLIASISTNSGSFVEADHYYQEAFTEFLNSSMNDQAGRTLLFSALSFLSQEKRDDYIQRLKDTEQFAKQNNLSEICRDAFLRRLQFQIDNDPTEQTIQELENNLDDAKNLGTDPILIVEARKLLSERWRAKGKLQYAKNELTKALSATKSVPEKEFGVLFALADISESMSDKDEAIRYLKDAISLAQGMKVSSMVLQLAYRKIIPLLLATEEPDKIGDAEQKIERLKEQDDKSTLSAISMDRAWLSANKGDYDSALKYLDEAGSYASSWHDRFLVLQGKVGTKSIQARKKLALGLNEDALRLKKEALDLTEKELALIMESLSTEIRDSIVEWKAILGSIETLYKNAAFMSADLGMLSNAWEWAENGRALRLRFLLNKRYPSHTKDQWMKIAYKDAIEFLKSDNAALVIYSVFDTRTLVLIIDPKTGISHELIEGFGDNSLKMLLPEEEQYGKNWNKFLSQAMEEVPKKLVEPLSRISVPNIYIVPDSRLNALSLQAITFEGGTCIMERYCTNIIPSLSILMWLRKRKRLKGNSCLALGAGQEQGYSFLDQARRISELSWSKSIMLPDPSDSLSLKEQFLSKARSFDVIHIASHGSVSQIFLDKPGSYLLPEEIEKISDMRADLVFLCACLSGKFHAVLPSEIGGFWEAFLLAGATTIIATLSNVHPKDAEVISHEFYKNWLSSKRNGNKARSLRNAQIALRKSGSADWAMFAMIGDPK